MAAIGIDLGTTYSCVGVVVNGKVEIIPNKRGSYITPSCVSFTKHGVVIGEDAKANLSEDPSNTILNVKRIIGLRNDDPVFQAETANLPYKIIEKDGETAIQISVDGETETYFPEEISGKVLSKMKEIAEEYLGEKVVSAVITIPARFNSSQRKKTREAAEYARLNVLRLLHEPTAAALAYGLQNEAKRDGRNVLVYDLGGGTFDVNVLTMKDDEFKITASSGDTHLGGEDFDQMMVAECIKEFASSDGVDLGNDPTAKYRLRKECEKTKIALSSVLHDEVKVDKIVGEKNFKKKFTRAKFEDLNDDSFTATMEAVDYALQDAKLDIDQIDDIVLVGGSTRIPFVQQMLRKHFKKQLCMSLDADQAVAYGAAICAAQITGNVTAELRHFTIRDVIPLSLGIMTKGGVMSVVIKRNTEFPTTQDGSYTTVKDDQTSITVSVYEGERARVALNHLLGSFVLDGIPPQLAGDAKIRILFKIDIDGLLHVSAIDETTGTESNIVIEWQKQSLSPERAKLEVQLADESRQEDEEWKTRVLTANELESSAKKLISILSVSTELPEDEKLNAIMISVGTISWLKQNPDANIKEIETQLQKLQKYSRFLKN